jgi:hypothetical protein
MSFKSPPSGQSRDRHLNQAALLFLICHPARRPVTTYQGSADGG